MSLHGGITKGSPINERRKRMSLSLTVPVSRRVRLLIEVVVVVVALSSTFLGQEKISDFERERDRTMLSAARDELVRHYFDPNFRGVNIDEKFKLADEMLKKVSTNSEAFYVIAAFMRTLDDSHTSFVPPSRSVKIDLGWRMQMIGDKCFVVAVRPDSLEEKDGLKLGDQILTIERFEPTRDDFWKMKYLFYSLNPMSEFNLVVQSGKDGPREILVHSKRTEGPHVTDLTNYNEYMNLVRDERVKHGSTLTASLNSVTT
jgi:hypothetical protein